MYLKTTNTKWHEICIAKKGNKGEKTINFFLKNWHVLLYIICVLIIITVASTENVKCFSWLSVHILYGVS